MKEYHFGEIVLLNFPFVDSINVKKRPALVLLDTQDNDIIVARITTQKHETAYDIEIHKWEKAGLLKESFVRFHKIATIEKKLVYKKLGKLEDNDFKNIKNKINSLWRLL